ncbi:MAG: HD domain-containing protein [Candidatus Krumholzibacteria bacterium]|nr:HD domain-containing protein [Candidatus Krumholzibacteria bacterium]
MKLEKWQKAVIEHGELYRVGGAVRDELLGVEHSHEDVDFLVRGISAKLFEKLLSRHGRLALVGKSFGVYKFKPTGEDIEHDIAFPRREKSTGPGHHDFDVEWEENLPVETDLARRDFTINAIAQSVLDGRIVDPFSGRKDIERHTLRMIFPEAFSEDPLRILRGIRFAARFSLVIEPETAAAMKKSTSLLASLSAERIQEELSKLLVQCERPSEPLAQMRKLGVLEVVFAELDHTFGIEQNEYHADDLFWHSLKSCDEAPRDNLLVRWAALLHDLGKVEARQVIREPDSPERVVFYGHEDVSARITQEVLGRLRYAADFVKRCRHLVKNHMVRYVPEWNRSTVRRFIRTIGEEDLEDMFALRRADLLSRGDGGPVEEVDELERRVRDELQSQHALKIEDMAIDGDDVMRVLGIGPGERVGRILHELFERVLETPSLNERETLLAIVEASYTDS